MRYTTVLGSLFSCLVFSSLVGCGGSEPTAIAEDELSKYLAKHPELVKASEEANKEREDNEKSAN